MIFISAYKNLQSTILSLIVLVQGFPFLYFKSDNIKLCRKNLSHHR